MAGTTKSGVRKWIIKDHSYFADVWFVTGTWKQIKAWLAVEFPKDEEEREFTGRHIVDDSMVHYIILPMDRKRPTTWEEAALAHECLHLTFAVLANAGIYHHDASEEAYTYYFQSMFVQMLRKILL